MRWRGLRMRFVLPLAIVVYLDILNPKLRERFCRFCEFRIKVMVSFLISSAIGFTIYQLAAWALLSEDRLFFRVGNSVINLAPEAATWLRRLLVVLLVGVGLTLVIWLHRPFAFPDDALGGAVILGFFYGPLLAIWINTLLAKPSKESPSIGQYVAGAGLALLFLVGSVGDQMGALILGYARQISKISFGGAELLRNLRRQAPSAAHYRFRATRRHMLHPPVLSGSTIWAAWRR